MTAKSHRFARVLAPFLVPFRTICTAFAAPCLLQGALMLGSQQLLAHHPQFDSANSVLSCKACSSSPDSAFGVAKLALDYPKRMLHLGSDAGLELSSWSIQRVNGVVLLVQRFALARAHRHMPGDIWRASGRLCTPLVARITKGVCLRPCSKLLPSTTSETLPWCCAPYAPGRVCVHVAKPSCQSATHCPLARMHPVGHAFLSLFLVELGAAINVASTRLCLL